MSAEALPRRRTKVSCGVHGTVTWQGDLVCCRCSRVYQTDDEAAPHAAPKDQCACGTQLMPKKGIPAEEQDFSARIICHDCFLDSTSGDQSSTGDHGAGAVAPAPVNEDGSGDQS